SRAGPCRRDAERLADVETLGIETGVRGDELPPAVAVAEDARADRRQRVACANDVGPARARRARLRLRRRRGVSGRRRAALVELRRRGQDDLHARVEPLGIEPGVESLDLGPAAPAA